MHTILEIYCLYLYYLLAFNIIHLVLHFIYIYLFYQ